jgi:hypothetical protein
MRYALQYDETLEAISTYGAHLEAVEAGSLDHPTAVSEHLEELIALLHDELTRLGELVPEMRDYAVTWS